MHLIKYFLSHQGTHNIMVEEAYIKDALSRIVVEMIKREWPQQWPDMLNEMDKLTAMGVSSKSLEKGGLTGMLICKTV